MPFFHFCASSLLPQDKFSVAEFSWKVFWRMKKYGKVWSRAHAVWLKLDARIGKKKYTPQKLNHGIFIFNTIILPATSNCETYLILSDCFGITRRSRSDVSEQVSVWRLVTFRVWQCLEKLFRHSHFQFWLHGLSCQQLTGQVFWHLLIILKCLAIWPVLFGYI